MLEELKIYLGDMANNYSDSLLRLVLKIATYEVKSYCNRPVDGELELIVLEISKIKLMRYDSEGLASQSYSGVSENYIDGYPAHIQQVLNSKRKIKTLY